MKRLRTHPASERPAGDWIALPGGELETLRPTRLCRGCRDKRTLSSRGGPGPLCFQCYREEANRERALRAACDLDTASDARFQGLLPFEPVNGLRLERLRTARATARSADQATSEPWVERRRKAQIAARHALDRIFAGVHARRTTPHEERAIAHVFHAAELQLPESWLPFVVSR